MTVLLQNTQAPLPFAFLKESVGLPENGTAEPPRANALPL